MNEIELIDFCEEHFTDYAVCKALKCEELCKDDDCPLVRVFNGYRAALRAEQERQWISVKDRLPDMCGCKCLVVGTNRFGQVDVFTAFTGYMERGKLEFHSCEPTHEIPAWTVTHWRELPAPPEEGAEHERD